MGCQLNENDSEKLKGMLSEMGYTLIEDRESADVIILKAKINLFFIINLHF